MFCNPFTPHALIVFFLAAFAVSRPVRAQAPSPTAEADEIEARLKALEQRVAASESGSSNFMVTGYGYATYDQRQGENRNFNAAVSPIFLWRLNNRILFSAELEVGLDPDTHNPDFGLEYANVSLVVSDYSTLVIGKMLTPFSAFLERGHPAWINKSVDMPLYTMDMDRQAPTNSLGVQVRGGVPVGDARLRYAVWAENGPVLNTDPMTAGTLQWENLPAGGGNNNAAVGAHLWLSPIPNLEFGAAWMGGRPGAKNAGFDDIRFNMLEGDVNFQLDSDALKGAFDARGEYVRVRITNAVYPGVPNYDNSRSGGYGQLAYRPAKAGGKFLKNLEPVFRYDWLNRPEGDPSGFSEKRLTLGLNYYLASSAVIKAAWQRLRVNDPAGAISTPGFVAVLAVGF